jgi:FKBP-type peptidyl-prolyl cis-trans isomerase
MKPIVAFLLSVLVILATVMAADKVVVETIHPAREGSPPVTTSSKYFSMVTLYIEHADGSKTPSGWSTRVSDGADVDKPFAFQPGVGLIEGWTQGVLQMKEGERAWIHVPAALGYGDRPMGSPGGAFYIPASSNLLFDIEIMVQDPERMEL